MDSIIFLRHGQAENNTKRMLSGRSPGVPLTAKGLEQAQNTARFLNGHKIAHIYSSPIVRGNYCNDRNREYHFADTGYGREGYYLKI